MGVKFLRSLNGLRRITMGARFGASSQVSGIGDFRHDLFPGRILGTFGIVHPPGDRGVGQIDLHFELRMRSLLAAKIRRPRQGERAAARIA